MISRRELAMVLFAVLVVQVAAVVTLCLKGHWSLAIPTALGTLYTGFAGWLALRVMRKRGL